MGMDAGASQQQTPETLVGRTLGTCTLERVLGRGGMGVVFLAQQARPHRQVAVKVLLLSLMPDPARRTRFLQRFRREADAVAALDHPNILPIFEYGEQTDLAYLVMPYVGGGTLRDRIERKGQLPLAEVAGFLSQAAAALDYAHGHGVIHRDVKPQNMLLYPDKRLMLSDFGIAKVAQAAAEEEGQVSPQLTTFGHVVGTPDYIAPEQAMGHTVDARADIYSLGVVLFYMVTGRVPFIAAQPMTVAAKHVSEAPPAPREFRPDLPTEAEKVILKALAKNPAGRYHSAGEFARAFRAALPSQTVQASPAQPRRTAQPAPMPIPAEQAPEIRREEKSARPGVTTPPRAPVSPPGHRLRNVMLALLAILLAAVGAYAAIKGITKRPDGVTATVTSVASKGPSSTQTLTPTLTPTSTNTPTPTNTPVSVVYQANKFEAQQGDLPSGTTIFDTETSMTADQFHKWNYGRVVDPTQGYGWQENIFEQLDRNGSNYLELSIDQFDTAADAHRYFQDVIPHFKQTQQHPIGQEEIDGLCCDTNPTDYNVFFRDQNVTVIIDVVVTGSPQANQDALNLGAKMDHHVHPSAALLMDNFFPSEFELLRVMSEGVFGPLRPGRLDERSCLMLAWKSCLRRVGKRP